MHLCINSTGLITSSTVLPKQVINKVLKVKVLIVQQKCVLILLHYYCWCINACSISMLQLVRNDVIYLCLNLHRNLSNYKSNYKSNYLIINQQKIKKSKSSSTLHHIWVHVCKQCTWIAYLWQVGNFIQLVLRQQLTPWEHRIIQVWTVRCPTGALLRGRFW